MGLNKKYNNKKKKKFKREKIFIKHYFENLYNKQNNSSNE